LLVHSQSGAFGLDLVRNGAKVAGLIDVEGNCAPITNAELDTALKRFRFCRFGAITAKVRSASMERPLQTCAEDERFHN
jgi:hypothetical protein